MDAIDEIKRLYYAATKATIRQDIERAIDLLKSLPAEEERQRAAVYMDGLVADAVGMDAGDRAAA